MCVVKFFVGLPSIDGIGGCTACEEKGDEETAPEETQAKKADSDGDAQSPLQKKLDQFAPIHLTFGNNSVFIPFCCDLLSM